MLTGKIQQKPTVEITPKKIPDNWPLPWAGTAYEPALLSLRFTKSDIFGDCNNEAHQNAFRSFIYGAAQGIARDSRRGKPELLSESQQAKKQKSIANLSNRLAGLVQDSDPKTAANLRRYAAIRQQTSEEVMQAAPAKRHSTHASTREVLRLIRLIEACTGKPHYEKVAKILKCAGYTVTASQLRVLRSNHGL